MFKYTNAKNTLKLFSKRGSRAAGFVGALMAASLLAPASASAFTVDGILSGDDAYGDPFGLTFHLDGKNGGVDQDINGGSLRIGRDGAAGDVFLLVSVPIEVTDNVYGDAANTVGSGWNPPDHPYSKLESSDKFQFELTIGDGPVMAIETELIAKANHDNHIHDFDPNNFTDDDLKLIKDDGGVVAGDPEGRNALVDYSSSLQYNIIQGFGDFENSPDPLSGPAPDADWVQAIQYEFRLNGSLFDSGTTLTLQNLDKFLVHSSPVKGDFENVVLVSCVIDNDCEQTTVVVDNEVPEPGSLALIGVGLAGLALRRRQRQAIVAA